MSTTEQVNLHQNPDMDPNGASTSQDYFETIGGTIHSLASPVHQVSAQQQGGSQAITASTYGTELWQPFLHDPQQQAHQLYNQYGQAPAEYQTDWPSYGTAFAGPALQGFVHTQFQNHQILHLQHSHPSQTQSAGMPQSSIAPNPVIQQQEHVPVSPIQNAPAQVHPQQLQYAQQHTSPASILHTLRDHHHTQQSSHSQLHQPTPLPRRSAPLAPTLPLQQSRPSPVPPPAPIQPPGSVVGLAEFKAQRTSSIKQPQHDSVETSALSSPLSNADEFIPIDKCMPSNSAVRAFMPTTAQAVPDGSAKTSRSHLGPKTSIPHQLTTEEYARECNQAAINSRLSPYLPHHGEYQILKKFLDHSHVATYLDIRNGILCLWHRNPLVSVTREEAAGCAKDYRFLEIAEVAYEWLVRNGYINFGCVEVPNTLSPAQLTSKRRKTIVVVGAGISGLSSARQLEGLIQQFGHELQPLEGPPEVIVLEARGRIGGRVYSHPLQNQNDSSLGPTKRATADLGAQIITGFDNGNPLNVLVRGQLALDCHNLKDNSRIYDIDGQLVDKERDNRTERLFNDILDRVAIFKLKSSVQRPTEGEKVLIDAEKDPAIDGVKELAKIEDSKLAASPMPPSPLPGRLPFSAVVDRLTGKPTQATGSSAAIPVIEQLRKLGWDVDERCAAESHIDPEPCGADPRHPTLGKTMDDLLLQYQKLLKLSPLDLRLINWHYANLEYANATTLDQLSLGSWDQDDGNEFRGCHAMLVGGYTQVARGLWLSPRKLDVRPNHVVKRVSYKAGLTEGKAVHLECENGVIICADKVVITLPLGVLKSNIVEFDPPLPAWKQSAIDRLGYGLLNKVVMVFNEPFWDTEIDMTGLLRSPIGDPLNQANYEARRGRFYLFWNCTQVSGRPMLVALMAGEAAYQAEQEDDETIVKEAVAELAKIYPEKHVPYPSETIITRWQKDKYTRGSYSYVAPSASGEDYDAMARPINDTIFFAGEATCGTHPATVHGAYISGLKAANDVIESLLGSIKTPNQLIVPMPKNESSCTMMGHKRKAERSAAEKVKELRIVRLEKYEEQLKEALSNALGERPVKPGRTGANPFLLYQKDHWFICKAKCDEARKQATGNPEAKATRNEVRAALGLMWREAPEEEKRPYLAATETNKKSNTAAAVDSKKRMQQWDDDAEKFKAEWRRKNPTIPSSEEVELTRQAELEAQEAKRNKMLNPYRSDLD